MKSFSNHDAIQYHSFKCHMDFNLILVLFLFIGIFAPLFWFINHFRELDPKFVNVKVSKLQKEPNKTKMEEIFGM